MKRLRRKSRRKKQTKKKKRIRQDMIEKRRKLDEDLAELEDAGVRVWGGAETNRDPQALR